jgi:hypothetical protein
MALQRSPRDPAKRGSGQRREWQTAPDCTCVPAGRRGRIFTGMALLSPSICVVTFRVTHPAKPPSHQRRLFRAFLTKYGSAADCSAVGADQVQV